jgi:DNA-binding CsgD family transcriptional regulator
MSEKEFDIYEHVSILKGYLAVLKGHFEPNMVLKNPSQTYLVVQEALEECWQIEKGISLTNSLSDREREIIKSVVEGLPSQEIAEKLFVDEKTVKFHLTNIYKKLRARNRATLIVEYYKNELREVKRDKENLQQQIDRISKEINRGRGELSGTSTSRDIEQ